MGEEIRLQVIDSHTGGEPTRVVVPPSRSGWWAECGWDGLDAAGGSMMERKGRLGTEFDWLRSACVNEPRGHEAMVGALLCEPSVPNGRAQSTARRRGRFFARALNAAIGPSGPVGAPNSSCRRVV